MFLISTAPLPRTGTWTGAELTRSALTYQLEDSGFDQGYFRRFIIHATTGMVLKRRDNDLTGEKKVVIIAGPNGAGKTTFALEFLPNEADCPNFINADLIASGLNPFAPEKAAIRAGKIMLDLMEGYIRRKESFSFETTLSGKGFARRIVEWQSKRYRVKLFFLRLPRRGIRHPPDQAACPGGGAFCSG